LYTSNFDDVVWLNLLPLLLRNMQGRERRPSVLKTTSWSNKRLLRQDETLQTFSWPHDTGALINEMKLVSEIVLSLSLPSLPSLNIVCVLSLSKYYVCAFSLHIVCVLSL
jgi:hypothetical protein